VTENIGIDVYYLEHFCQLCGKPYTYPEGCNPQWCRNMPAAISAGVWKDTLERLWRLEKLVEKVSL
jgi:DNA polymerase III epsilon subunit-like protein